MKKYKNIIFSIIMLLLLFTSKVNGKSGSLIGKTIYLDAGHGGIDCGATYKDLKESYFNLVFVKEIGKQIEKKGGTVLYTRTGDYDLSSTNNRRKRSDLSNRVKLINDSKADIYISVHMNSLNNSTWHGTQTFYTKKNDSNIILAKKVQKQFKNSNISNRDISIIKDTYMYDKVLIPGVLVEVAFMSNYSDRMKIQDPNYVSKFSKILVDGIIEYFR